MARTKKKAGKAAVAARRDGPPARKSGATKPAASGSRKPKQARLTSQKQKPSAASETAGLKAQLKAARIRQQASAEILHAVANTSGDAERSLQLIAETTARLFGASSVRIRLVRDGEWGSTFHVGGSSDAVRSSVPEAKARIGAPNLPGTVVTENRQIHISDLDHIPPEMANWPGLPPARAAGARVISGTPLRRGSEAIGVLIIHRDRPTPFTSEELALQQSFADQAVIAIENARLFNETKEALERQTATADILKVIASSPSDVQPVFEAIAASAKALIGGFSATVSRIAGDMLHLAAFTPTNASADEVLQASFPIPLAEFLPFESIRGGETLQFVDTEAEGVPVVNREVARLRGYRSMLFTPLMKNGQPIGMISVTRKAPGAFIDHHVELLQTFADQAVIAIENARLFNETKEALERQTATADILKVIASSPSDVQPVFEAIATRANSLVGGFSATVFRFIDGMAHLMAFTPTTPAADETLKSSFPSPVDSFAPFQIARDGEVTQIPDTETLTGDILQIARARGFRSMLFAPLMNKGASIGLIAVTRLQTGAFSDHHVQLLRTFADQAVIAIENARLFDEVQAKTRDLEESLQQQTATADVLKVISRSPDKLKPVLDVIVETSRELCDALTAVIFLLRDGKFHDVAESSTKPEYVEAIRANPIALDQKGSVLARAAREKRTVHILNSAEDPEAGIGGPLDAAGPRSLLSVPLILEGRVIGGITLKHARLAPFTARQIEAVETFADQAVIAISNVNLFEQVQQRTRELAASLDDLRAAQDRLVQTEKLASLGQLTAGIAHEIKNPLNFVNNFSALSAELVDELDDALAPAPLDAKLRGDVGELTQMLKSNLEKVVQHGKRADSIVKNMLLHSREGSGDHRPADINALVEESLNLAYHGARAEKSGFNITLKRDLDPAAGMIDLYPQEITRVLLNLISNGFYAAAKRHEADRNGFEPTLAATTRNLGANVEIRVRDNGTGIPADVREKMFNPFFTTKPAGEGTGLGLSMSHDIVVKQHGGTIDVQTEPGSFTEFIITLPRQRAA